jgi:hypothetical protein
MTEVVKTLRLYDEKQRFVCDIDIAWIVHPEHFDGPYIDGLDHTKKQVRAYAGKHMVPDEGDIADARAA